MMRRYFMFVLLAWIAAWLVHEWTAIGELPAGARSVYWTLAKLIIWIAPILLMVGCAQKRSIPDYLGLVRFRRGVRVGMGVAAAFVTLSAGVDAFTRSYAWPSPSWGLLNALVIAPLFEEVMFRGFVLRSLEDEGCRFWRANVVAALMFLGLHLPGWYFSGGLGPSRLLPAVGIVVIGLVAGFAKRRAGSTWASVTFHAANNLYAAFLR